jgi:hypothetical protein
MNMFDLTIDIDSTTPKGEIHLALAGERLTVTVSEAVEPRLLAALHQSVGFAIADAIDG